MSERPVIALKDIALASRHRLFEALLTLEYDSLPYIGHLITKVAIERGYTEPRKNLKGKTVSEWAKSLHSDGKGAPNRWACLAAADLLVSHRAIPDTDDAELWAALVFHWDAGHGPFESAAAALEALTGAFQLDAAAASQVQATLATV